MKNTKKNITALCLMISIPLLNILYGVLNHGDRGAYSLMTDIDRSIPFLKIFIIPYVAWYLFLICTLAYFCLKDRETYYKTLLSLNLGLLICYGVYFFYQTAVPRPILVGEDILTKIVAWVYATDQPFNCFPSIHSLSSYLMFKGIRHSSIRNHGNQLVISGIAFTVILSTLFVKQHAVLDAIAAIFLGEVLFNLISATLWIKREAVEKYTLNIGEDR
ncbi:MAG: serine/threonine protein phosphatase [Anaerosolibacter sp.]|uniref:phosphatase PAP2 family protein n=1 Tax=Anaerosolibacter sp. TaxID=1872527 RepID=UPI00262FBB00|nr:phosphatase PAP2 family protein [Anaerosolibacter sp.]MDF2548292.1 serine/threonine protein phosphatase [Anaerosolibacter sp.]